MGSTRYISALIPLYSVKYLSHHSTLTMRTTTIVLLASLLMTIYGQGPPRVRKLDRMDKQLTCSLDELLKCQEEITKAVEDCEHISDWTDVASILTCINDILATKDCQKCVCDVIPVVCP